MTSIPHTTPALWPRDIPSTRMAAHIHAVPVGCRVGLLGLPDDLGVRLNSGRPGAKDGPRAFREALAKYGVAEPHGFDWPKVFDAGDIIVAEGQNEAALHETHRRVTEAVAALLAQGLLPVGIGGGHDLTFPLVRAVAKHVHAHDGSLAGVYFDAHLDVRETVGSGMPFRRLIDECGIRELHAFGINPAVNSREHQDWFAAHGGMVERVRPGDQLRLPSISAHRFVSFDLDVLDASHAPGVSALNPCGWQVQQAEAWVHACGRAENVRCFDIMELNPAHDEQARTARVAAHLFLTFLRGFAERRP